MTPIERELFNAVKTIITSHRALQKRVDAIETKGIKYAGVWQRAQDYKRGDVVTHDGSAWVAIAEETRAAPGATQGWQLMVKGTR
jgi:hypothetical protein